MSAKVNLEGLAEKRRGQQSLWYENINGEVVAKRCSKCFEVKLLVDFPKQAKGLGGKSAECNACATIRTRNYRKENPETAVKYRESARERRAEYDRKWYQENRDRKKKYQKYRVKRTETDRERSILKSRKWREANREKKNEYDRMWRRNNPHKNALSKQRRRARKRALPNDLTPDQYNTVFEHFGNACALTGRKDGVEMEHAIPLSIGHGGTTFGNCYPMASGLNQSKFNHNIFEWFNTNKGRFELAQGRFDRLIHWLADANKMTTEEYKDYVYECHANPYEIDDAMAN